MKMERKNNQFRNIPKITPVGKDSNSFPTGQPHTRGGERKNTILINQSCDLFISPENQARQLGEHKPYQGKQNVGRIINVELTGNYGRLGKSYKYHFFINQF